jgi:hypothetical protein
MSKKTFLAPFLVLVLAMLACGRGTTPSPAGQTEAPAAASAPTEQANTPALRLDCIPASGPCRELKVAGDASYRFPDNSASPFSGYADPSIRKDPQSNTLWLSYSWPNYHLGSVQHTPSIDTHLAKSTDGGSTWTFVKSLWPSTPLTNPADPTQKGYLESEVSNLLPVLEGGRVTWYAARLSYFMPEQGGVAKRPVSSFQLRLFKAVSPEALSDAPYAVLGMDLTPAAWGVSQNLQSLSPDLKAVTIWNEPALNYEGGRLYLVTVGFAYNAQGAVMSKNGVFVFSTDPSGAPDTWQWTYNGQLAGPKEASELGGERLTQTDIVRGVDGRLLLVASPDEWNASLKDYNHKGCVVIEIQSLSTPRLARDANGRLVVRAVISASDSNELGSAACSYDPASSTGILFTRRIKSSTELTVSIWSTGVRP